MHTDDVHLVLRCGVPVHVGHSVKLAYCLLVMSSGCLVGLVDKSEVFSQGFRGQEACCLAPSRLDLVSLASLHDWDLAWFGTLPPPIPLKPQHATLVLQSYILQ